MGKKQAEEGPRDILSYVPAQYQGRLRPVQEEALREVERSWHTSDVIILNLPVAAGKSLIAQTISRWSSSLYKQKAITLASNNLLVHQYLADYPRLPVLHGQGQYFCTTLGSSLASRPEGLKLCSDELGCQGCSARRRDLRKIHVVPYALANYYTYLAHKLWKSYSVVIVDEAHNLIPVLQEMGSQTVWRHKIPTEFQYPLDMGSVQWTREWLDSLPEELLSEKFRRAIHSNKNIVKVGDKEYHGEMRPCIQVSPLDLSDEPSMFFPSSLRKMVLMSATISEKDIEQLGLYRRRVKYISASSPIPASQRPVIFLGSQSLNMSWKHQAENLPALVDRIESISANYPEDKGLIHVPYSLATRLRSALGDNPRYLFHTKSSKMRAYSQFRESTEPTILVASGMSEGIDLPYDAGRFQIITKIPFPSLAEAAIKFKAERDPKWYAWETVKVLQQAFGRICRGPSDRGDTYVLDSSFARLVDQNLEFFPEWLLESMYREWE